MKPRYSKNILSHDIRLRLNGRENPIMKNIVKLINEAKNITVVTGAGVSVSGGISDYQTANKEWKYEEDRFSVMSYPFFKQEPERFWEIYREIRAKEISKTAFHDFVKSLEDNADVTVVTQNVDGLHQESGSENVIEVHGSRNYLICINENILFSIDLMDKEKTPKCPNCSNVLKPDVSLFFEGVRFLSEAREAIMDSDLLIVAGTSLNVGPFNELVLYGTINHKPSIWINLEKAPDLYAFTEQYLGSTDKFASDMVNNASSL